MEPWPVLISIPHGGRTVPEEILGRVCLSDVDLMDDIDAYAVDLYNVGSRARHVIAADIARPFVDLNRAPDDRPPNNPDGVVKTSTCYGVPVYEVGHELDDRTTEALLAGYYEPYHRRIREALEASELAICLDCHTMAAVGPAISPDVGAARPTICLGTQGGKTCENRTAERLADCFREAWQISGDEVSIDRPFRGGHITRTYGMRPLPWVQVELNRELYLNQPWFDREGLLMDRSRLRLLNEKFAGTLESFFS